MSAWTPLLDRLERQIARQEDALARGIDPPPPLDLEAPDAAMAVGELVRATALMARNDALLSRTAESLASRRRRSPSPYS